LSVRFPDGPDDSRRAVHPVHRRPHAHVRAFGQHPRRGCGRGADYGERDLRLRHSRAARLRRLEDHAVLIVERRRRRQLHFAMRSELIALVGLAGAFGCRGSGPMPATHCGSSLVVARSPAEIALDGELSEPVWLSAHSTGAFASLADGGTVSPYTELRATWTPA